MKKGKVVVAGCLLYSAVACASVGGGFGKMWDGIKDVASGTWDAVSSPFRSKEEPADKKVDDKKSKKPIRKA